MPVGFVRWAFVNLKRLEPYLFCGSSRPYNGFRFVDEQGWLERYGQATRTNRFIESTHRTQPVRFGGAGQ